jgi:phospholipase/carboxylesterase
METAGTPSLTARPRTRLKGALHETGLQPLGLKPVRDALFYVPPAPGPGEAAGLVVTLHGAGGDAAQGMSLLLPLADTYNMVLLAPASRGSTWDALRPGRYGPDVTVLDHALDHVFGTLPVNPERVAIAGFSDGASYALGLGLANGGLFRRIIAFSPGFIPPGGRAGKPDIFISHGTDDDVLPVASTSRRIVPALTREGYQVCYREFHGPHAVPPEVAVDAAEWLDWNLPGNLQDR